MTTRGAWFMRDRPVLFWLFVALVVSLVHPFLASSRWLMVHLVVLGALTHAAMVWSVHFTEALLKTRAGFEERRIQTIRLSVFQAGVVLVIVGVPWSLWALTLAGAALISGAVIWHAVMLVARLRAALPGRFRITVRYYIAAALLLPVGATFGVLLARGVADPWHGRLLVAHSMINLLGFIGLTILGTLVTLWPTMLRTRMAPQTESTSQQALPVLVLGLTLVVVGSLLGRTPVAAAGILAYLGGTLWVYRAVIATARKRPPAEFPTLSAGAGLVWLPVGLGLMVWSLIDRATWAALADHYGVLTTIFVVGFALQVLLGALSYLLPVVIGGGPSVLRAGKAELERWGTLRVVVANLCLALALLPVPSLVRVVLSVLVLLALATSIPLLLRGIIASVRAKRAKESQPASAGKRHTDTAPTSWSRSEFITGLAVTAVGASLGVGLDPAAAGIGTGAVRSSSTDVTPTGRTKRVTVTARDMRFHPAAVSVPVGDRLVITLVNTDPSTVHDLVLANGASSGRLSPGQRATVDVGVVGASIDGWCSVVGHRQMGMVFTVNAVGTPATDTESGMKHPGHGTSADGPSPEINFMQHWPAGFTAYDPVLPPLRDERVHRLTLTAKDVRIEVAPGVTQTRWTYNGSSIGPVLHGRVGDRFEVTLVNKGTMGHSIDFHASEVAPDGPMRTIPPGKSLVYRFTAKRSGVWLYHCSTMPMSLHISAGMAGVVVIEPPDLPPVDRSYVLAQSELHLGVQGGPPDAAKVAADKPDAVVFNGFANQYVDRPLRAKVGERVRLWVLDIGPDRPLAFHVVGGQFDTVYKEGTYLLKRGRGALDPPDADTGGSQVLDLLAAQGGFVELTFPEAGHYSIVNHIMTLAEKGARGTIEVTA